MVDVARARKLAVRIREVVSMTLETQVKDPRLGMVTITDAKVTPDLREATLYYTVYGSDEERQSRAIARASAQGVLRKTVGQQTGVRYTPSLQFVADVVPETAGRGTARPPLRGWRSRRWRAPARRPPGPWRAARRCVRPSRARRRR